MSDFKDTNMVVQSNNLIQQTNWKLNQVPLKILKACISCIDTKHPTNNVSLRKNQLLQFIDSKESENYSYLKKKCNELITAVKVYDDYKKEIYVALVQKIEWEKDSEHVHFTFSSDLMPFLINLKSNFLQYQVSNLNCFSSKYSLIIYEYLLSMKRRTQEINHFYISVEELRRLTGTEKKLKTIAHLEEKILKVAMSEINNNPLEIIIKYEKIKVGRKIEEVKFSVRIRKSHDENSY